MERFYIKKFEKILYTKKLRFLRRSFLDLHFVGDTDTKQRERVFERLQSCVG